jgi:formylglycine-generating enzyme
MTAHGEMVALPGGTYTMGSDAFYPEEAPSHQVSVGPFRIDRHPVTNAQFAAFVTETGHVTVAERAPNAEDYPDVPLDRLVPGAVVFSPPPWPVDLRDPMRWWAYVGGADWRHPTGPGSVIDGKDDHPVVQVAYADAVAYAAWAGKQLPTEAQWECAARGGIERAAYAWGDEPAVGGRVPANVWRGEFPWGSDGPWGTEPVGSYPPNGFGLFDVVGQVWEWTQDWWQPGHDASGACCSPRVDPRGPLEPRTDPAAPRIPMRVLKGGSFLCADSYCMRYRPAARIAEAVDTATCHVGFRCVVNA